MKSRENCCDGLSCPPLRTIRPNRTGFVGGFALCGVPRAFSLCVPGQDRIHAHDERVELGHV